MPQTYKKKEGGRNYRIHDPDIVSKAIKDIKKGISISAASRKYGIPFSTLRDKLNVQHPKRHGGQTTLSSEEETILARAINQLAEWSYPLNKTDIQVIIKNYLDKKGETILTFKENMPGKDFITGFMKRNNLTQRTAANITRARSSVTQENILSFFNNIKQQLQNVPPENIFNFDETNVTDDPGSKKVIVFRGSRRIERQMEHSKVAISLMFCISASGEILPPYVVYKAENLYENWCVGGPEGAKYGVSKTGWFDNSTFEEWFTKIFLPFIHDRQGKKIVIGDNLASHFSPKVIELCANNNIYFTTIPPNSTHLMQPLDVAFFRPLKIYWRSILETWRKETRLSGTIPKEIFPSLIRKLYGKLEDTGTQNAKSGFRKTGLHPFNPAEVIRSLPSTSRIPRQEDCTSVLNESIFEFLKEQRGTSSGISRRGRGKKVVPGCAITSDRNLSSSNILKEQQNNGLCALCQCRYSTYRGPDWIQCTYCKKWICGFCNRRSKDLQFICEACLDED